MKLLSVWLLLVAVMRLSAFVWGYTDLSKLQVGVYSETELSPLHGREFSAWTATTASLCLICALNLNSRPIYLATMMSFVIAEAHFLLEFFVFRTMSVQTFISPAIIASVSALWMLLNWSNTASSAIYDSKRS
ncbi:hypothetical protein CBR_g29820 [Chara braunii]|uniref:Ergosterol biosynthetic protein 28 n=1 Tax=Chara braunii TaxID=69332 RepID=A0A388LBW1_CHABU|nr:hypothetical protein CBR_g29820 [Chara braunii]|eukprot:GBG79672.1 hypothetical protein CBR_g29820 [Chara braunii]